jgi:hypothetical protein
MHAITQRSPRRDEDDSQRYPASRTESTSSVDGVTASGLSTRWTFTFEIQQALGYFDTAVDSGFELASLFANKRLPPITAVRPRRDRRLHASDRTRTGRQQSLLYAVGLRERSATCKDELTISRHRVAAIPSAANHP